MTHVLRSTQFTHTCCSHHLLVAVTNSYPNIKETDSIYIIEGLVSGKRITTHIHNLRPFIYDPIRTNPLTVAQHNEQEFIVESILGHRGNRNR